MSGDLVCIGCSIRMEGTCGDVVAIGGSIMVDGTVKGSVVAVGGGVLLGDNASVSEDVVTVGGHLSRHPNAVVKGDVSEQSGALILAGNIPCSSAAVDPDRGAGCLAGQAQPQADASACRPAALISTRPKAARGYNEATCRNLESARVILHS